MKSEFEQDELNLISEAIIDAGLEVHREIGPGLLESIYEDCLSWEIGKRGFTVERQKVIPVIYKNTLTSHPFRLDMLIEDKVVVEIKNVERLIPIHEAQILTYLKLTGCAVGLLLNFNAVLFKNGIKRIVNGFDR